MEETEVKTILVDKDQHQKDANYLLRGSRAERT